MKYLISFAILLATFACAKAACFGCIHILQNKELQKYEPKIKQALNKLPANKNDKDYSLVKINSGSSQVVAGILYRFNVDLENNDEETTNCNIKIWSQPWLKINKATLYCPDEQDIEWSYSDLTGKFLLGSL